MCHKNSTDIIKEYQKQLHSFINKRVSDSLAADDILQEVFIKIDENLDKIKEQEKIAAYIYQITRNTIINYYRKKKSFTSIPENLKNEEKQLVEKQKDDIAQSLTYMIEKLPEPYANAIMLSEIKGLTGKEVAEKQKISLPAAKSRIQRGRKLLKGLLHECCNFEFDHQGNLMGYKKK